MHTISTTWLKRRAHDLGFPVCGISTVEPMDASALAQWLKAGYGAEMAFLSRHLTLRSDLASVLTGARSVISVALPYPGPTTSESTGATVARYARGRDYHDVVNERLALLWEEIQAMAPGEQARIFVDAGPLPERELARRAGLGWVGKHSCLINSCLGSRFVLGEILTTLHLPPSPVDLIMHSQCGDCQCCMQSCPTSAITAPGIIDARRCLSYLTIEHKGPIPRTIRPLMGLRLFGCDTCQDVCPHNKRVGEILSELQPSDDLLNPDPAALLSLTPTQFNARFKGTPIQRAKRRGLLRNACIVLGNAGDRSAIASLTLALKDTEPLIRGHAAWAMGQLRAHEILEQALPGESDPWVQEEIQLAIHEAGAS